ncbi:ankyrin repeat domain-containing protein [Pseudoxanthomonas winnipegensis]|uniref:Ankyrin repeat domain-containing protein n=1 Tax=Pseudoxanthomonas winnipegensis TaxID=2480810 RepID=A0A4Q8M3I0_9GAMM|nr:ankyrin repeat domain-containing protein [Pseudoxanthomonas winnipegensis]TAA41552.1 ankyrin repeat domain-containing protein [Pseudoxanthomonas winnipegensis]
MNLGEELIIAVVARRPDHVRSLLAQGADPNYGEGRAGTPLHFCAGRFHADPVAERNASVIAEILIGAGARIMALDRTGKTSVDEARACQNQRLYALLTSHQEASEQHERMMQAIDPRPRPEKKRLM